MDLFSQPEIVEAELGDLVPRVTALLAELEGMGLAAKVQAINEIRLALHKLSPFASEPVDCVLWIPADEVTANDYNPNSVAPPEMRLLEHSIGEDGYTQPIVSWRNGDVYEVVDGFHRNRVGKESKPVRERIHGYLPLTVINDERLDKSDRIAATIRHNRARGKHRVDAMSDIVIELKRRNWTDEKISRELGMEQDEIVRLCQITGLTELFSDQEFSAAWDVEGPLTEADLAELAEELTAEPSEEEDDFRTVNTSDPDRIFHTWEKWECHKAGFYDTHKDGMSRAECEEAFGHLLSDPDTFAESLEHVITEWKHSCEHYLTNVAMNRIAWLGQAAACYALGIPATFRSGYNLLTAEQQLAADEVALVYLNKWLETNGRKVVGMDAALSYERQSDIY
jgi:ParB-like chromosome segregation protein Spo0J